MNWNKEAKSWAVAHGMGSLALGPVEAKKRQTAVMHAARWQRDQLRTDEAIERVAQAIGEWEPEDWDNPEFREDRAFWTDKARTAINALLGED